MYIQILFSASHGSNVQYSQSDFNRKGGSCAIVKRDWNKKREADLTNNRTKTTNAELDEFVDKNLQKVTKDGTYKPYESMHNLLQLIATNLGRKFGIHSGSKLTNLQWTYLKLDTHMYEPTGANQKYAMIAPEGGFEKAHYRGINNPTITNQFPVKPRILIIQTVLSTDLILPELITQ